MNILAILALSAGSAIAIQAAINSRLGMILGSSMLGTSIAFLCSFFFALLFATLFIQQYPTLSIIKSVPGYLWFAGGALSAFGVGLFYFLIPKMGVGPMMSYALTGQLLMATVASHFGWFDLPLRPVDNFKIAGGLALLAGVLLTNWETSYG